MASYDPAMKWGSTLVAPVSSSYCVPHDSQLTLMSKVTMHGDKYTIDNAEGQRIFDATVISKLLSCHSTGSVSDASGKTFAYMKHKYSRSGLEWEVFRDAEASDSSFLFKMKMVGIFSTSYQIFLTKNGRSTPDFTITEKGCFNGKYTLLQGSSPLAEGTKKGSRYNWTVNPGVDLAFISTVFIVLEQIHKLVDRASGGAGA